ncbi:MAG: hypothetical protein ACLUHE_05430 [Christensenellales bacterium]
MVKQRARPLMTSPSVQRAFLKRRALGLFADVPRDIVITALAQMSGVGRMVERRACLSLSGVETMESVIVMVGFRRSSACDQAEIIDPGVSSLLSSGGSANQRRFAARQSGEKRRSLPVDVAIQDKRNLDYSRRIV